MAASRIGTDILAGAWPPGVRLGVVELSQHYGIGPTPTREALQRLASSGLIAAVGRRGFRASQVSEGDLIDITRLRTVVETEALRHSVRSGRADWEAGIAEALGRLTDLAHDQPEALREGTPGFDALHKGFHRALIAACGSARLLDLHDDLYNQAYRYRRVMMSQFVEPGIFITNHRTLAEAVLSRDFARARAELAGHLGQTFAYVYGRAMPQPEGEP